MSNNIPSGPHSHPKHDEAAPAPSFDEKLQTFWTKNSKFLFILGGLIIVAIIAYGGYEYLQKEKEAEIAADYAAATTPEKLKAFASAHADHMLAGAAYLKLADEAYSAQKYAEAAVAYEKASTTFKAGVFGARASLGAALSKTLAGQTAEGEARLKQIANDVAQIKPIRSEATYHLATLAAADGRNDEAIKLFDAVATIDPTTSWAQNAMRQRTMLANASTTPAAPVADAAPSIQFPGSK